MPFLTQPLMLPFICHKSATTDQIDLNKASNSKLKPDLCNSLKTEITVYAAPPQQPHVGTSCLGHPVYHVSLYHGA